MLQRKKVFTKNDLVIKFDCTQFKFVFWFKEATMYDLVIVGSGPAGLSAAVYAKRAGLNMIIIEKKTRRNKQIQMIILKILSILSTQRQSCILQILLYILKELNSLTFLKKIYGLIFMLFHNMSY